MEYNPKTHRRRSIRLKGYDYSHPGMYYATLCVGKRLTLFGEVIDNVVRLSAIGEVVRGCWEEIPKHFPNVKLDRYIVMPNHLHGILVLRENALDLVGVEYIQPRLGQKKSQFQHVVPRSLGSIIRAFKAAVTRICRQNGHTGFEWQRDYYDHVIRDGHDLDRIRRYIIDNPANWANDQNFPGNIRMDKMHWGQEDWSALD